MGNFVCDVLRDATGADAAILPAAFFKSGLPSGAITLGDLFNSMPFDHYADLLTDTTFLTSLILTCIYTLLSVAAEIAAGLAVALLLNLDLPWIGLFRTALIVPLMMTPVVAAIAWKLLLDPSYGVVNALLGLDVIWLGDPITALITVTLVDVLYRSRRTRQTGNSSVSTVWKTLSPGSRSAALEVPPPDAHGSFTVACPEPAL